MRHARSETFILPGGNPAIAPRSGSASDPGSRSGRRFDGADGLDADLEPKRVEMTRPQRRIASETLLGGERTLVIQHQGEEYTLRLTRLGKLLLTK